MEIIFALYLITIVIYYSKIRTINIGIFLLSIWCISAYFGILYSSHEYTSKVLNLKTNYNALIYLFIVSIIFFIPILKFRSDKIKSITRLNRNKYYTLSIVSVIFSTISFFIYLPKLPSLDLNSMANTYASVNTAEFIITKNSILGLILTICRSFEDITLILFFYTITYHSEKRILVVGLLFSSIIPILAAVIGSQRNYLVFYLLNFTFLTIIFYKLFSPNTKKTFRQIFIVLTIFISCFFLMVTYARFSEDSNATVLFFINSYLSQGFLNFSTYMWDTSGYTYGDTCFPIFRRLLGFDYSESLSIYIEKWSNKISDVPHHLFYTFIGDLLKDFGAKATFILSIVFAYFGSKLTKIQNQASIHKILLILIIFEICGTGIFYFINRSFYGNYKILMTGIIYIYLRITNKSNTLSCLK